VLVLPSKDGQQTKDHHEAVVKLPRDAHELVLGFEQQQQENVKLVLRNRLEGFLVDFDEQPHSEDVQPNVESAHVVFVDVEASDDVEEAVDVQTQRRVLNGACLANQLRVVTRALQVDFRLFAVCLQVNHVHSRTLPHNQRHPQVENWQQILNVDLHY
jgi:hypothetical protein